MRSLWLIVVSVVVVGVLFYLIAWRTTPPPVSPPQPIDTTSTPAQLPTGDDAMPLGRGQDVWVQTIDGLTGRIISEFRAAEYRPRDSRQVDVQSPQVRFYFKNGGVLELDAQRGLVRLEGTEDNRIGSMNQSPRAGRLEEVAIRFRRGRDEPVWLAGVVPALEFDALTYRLATVDTTIDGRLVPGEVVPVKLSGVEYDFEGRGLIAQWNEPLGRLDRLEVLRGGRLLVKDATRWLPRREGLPLASTQSVVRFASFIQAQADAPADDLYAIRFQQDVRATLEGAELANADVLVAVTPFAMDEPASASLSKVTPVSHRLVRNEPASVRPMEISWTGPLTVLPAPDEREETVSLQGSPASVLFEGVRASADLIRSTAGGDAIVLDSFEDRDVRLDWSSDGATSVLRTRRIDVDQTIGAATLTGPGRFESTDADGIKAELTFEREGALIRGGEGSQLLRFDGGVAFAREQGRLKARRLDLGFDGQDDSLNVSALRSLEASGGVRLDWPRGDQALTVSGDEVAMTLVDLDGQPTPSAIRCTGNVVIEDPQQFITASSLAMTLDASVPLEDERSLLTLDATEARTRSTDGQQLQATTLRIEPAGDSRRVMLDGTPAVVGTKQGRVRGDRIIAIEDGSSLIVLGAGSLDASDETGRATVLAWRDRLDASPRDGRADARGQVEIRSRAADGTTLIAAAPELSAWFDPLVMDAPQQEVGLRKVDLVGSSTLDVTQADQRTLALRAPGLSFEPQTGMIRADRGGQLLSFLPAEDGRQSAMNLALAWAGRLDWNASAGELSVTDDIRMGIERTDRDEEPLRLWADRLDARLSPLPLDQIGRSGQSVGRVDLESIRAQGDVSVRSPRASFDCSFIDFNARSMIATASGDQTRPVNVFDERGIGVADFSSLQWNVETGLIENISDVEARWRR
jgi:hypothetical protein